MKRRRLLLGAAGAVALAGAGVSGWRAAVGSMPAYDAYAASLRTGPGADPDLAALVRAASLAPNSHNTQPWRFRLEDAAVTIAPDPGRRTPAVDPDDHHLFVSLGAAAETLAISGAATGRPGALEIASDGVVTWRFTTAPARPDPLLPALLARQSTRADYDGRPLAPADLAALEQAVASIAGVRLVLIEDRPRLAAVRDLVIDGNRVQMGDPAFIAELRDWIRFNPREAMASGDGLFAAASGNPNVPGFLGRRFFGQVFTLEGETRKYVRQLASTPAIAIFIAEAADPAHWVAVGRALQRFALTATHLGIRTAHVNQPVEVAALRPELATLAGAPGLRPDLVLRVGRGPLLPYSPRRPVAAVVDV